MTLYAETDVRGDCTRAPYLKLTRMEAVRLLRQLADLLRVMPQAGSRMFEVPVDSVQVRRA